MYDGIELFRVSCCKLPPRSSELVSDPATYSSCRTLKLKPGKAQVFGMSEIGALQC